MQEGLNLFGILIKELKGIFLYLLVTNLQD